MAHDHGHGHHHDHGHEHLRNYFTEQLLTILVVGAMGFVAVRMYMNGMVDKILAERFRMPLFVGGIAVLVLVALRAISVWKEAGELHGHGQEHDHDHGHTHHHHDHHDHDHDHVHGPECQHDHHDHQHGNGHAHAHAHDHADHGHSHDPAWMFVRMLILFFPVTLFFLGLPNEAMVKALGQYLRQRGGDADLIPADALDASQVSAKPGTVLSFNDLNGAAFDPAKRESMAGQTAVLEGRFQRRGDRTFTLYRIKMTCCAADTISLQVQIVATNSLGGFNDDEWVQVTGRIQFVQRTGPDGEERYVPVIRVDNRDIVKKPRPAVEFE